jgi:protein TonB
VIVSQFRQPGEIAAKRVQDQSSAVGLLGAVLVARRDEPLQSEATDLSNVVPFARPRRHGAAPAFPLPSVAANERPAPHTVKFGIGRGIALLVGSVALHSTLLAMVWHQPRPLASIGVEVMTVEITLGATTAAGVARPGEQEAQVAVPSEERALEEPVTEQARVATVMPQEVPVAPQETAPEAMPQDTLPEVEAAESEPHQQRPEPETAVAAITAATQTPERTEQPRPQAPPVQKAPERKRTAAPTDKKAAQKKQHAAAATDSASGIGRGRSDHSTNYDGKIVAHLARHNPDSARRADAQGVATVSFSIDGGGRVTSVRLVSGSGKAAIDQEVVAMPRRASPFPPPPDGKGRNFTVPVRLNLR